MKDKDIRKLLTEQKKSKDICKQLGISDREWRFIVQEYNSQYENKERLIVSDYNGYQLTTNKNIIKRYALNRIRHALSELNAAKKILKVLSSKNQLKLIDDEQDLVDVCMKVKNG